MSEMNYEEGLINTFKDLYERFPNKWEQTTSNTCFSVHLPKNALYVCNYLDSNGYKNLSLYTIDNDGNLRNNLVISEHDEQELYNTLMTYYEKIKQQVRVNNLGNISSLLNSEAV